MRMLFTGVTPTAALITNGVSTDQRLLRLEVLDLTNIKRKLMEPYPEGKGWTEAQCNEAEKWYKRYLATIIKYPDATCHVPNGPIDAFWHQHILDTRAYRENCAEVLGYFLDHYPYFGLNGDAAERDTSFDETNRLYRLMFGEDCTNMSDFGIKRVVGQQCTNAPCSAEACRSGCKTCTVDGDRARAAGCTSADPDTGGVSCGARDGGGAACSARRASNCNHGGGGTGCGQGCSRSRSAMGVMVAAGCGDKGSGTGCRQGCSRGK